jgi:hypothetical protein
MKHFTRIAGLFLVLLSGSPTVAAGSREDELISMKIEAHASLDTQRNLKEWCEKKYPGTAALAEKVGFYLYPRIATVDARDLCRRSEVVQKPNAFITGHLLIPSTMRT